MTTRVARAATAGLLLVAATACVCAPPCPEPDQHRPLARGASPRPAEPVGCSAWPEPPGPRVVDARTVVLDEAAARTLARHVGAGGVWTPTPEVVAWAEDALPVFLAIHEDPRAPWLGARLDLCVRQWAGIVLRGRRLVCANVFVAPPGSAAWRRQVVFGAAGFRALFDLETGRFVRLIVDADVPATPPAPRTP